MNEIKQLKRNCLELGTETADVNEARRGSKYDVNSLVDTYMCCALQRTCATSASSRKRGANGLVSGLGARAGSRVICTSHNTGRILRCIDARIVKFTAGESREMVTLVVLCGHETQYLQTQSVCLRRVLQRLGLHHTVEQGEI